MMSLEHTCHHRLRACSVLHVIIVLTVASAASISDLTWRLEKKLDGQLPVGADVTSSLPEVTLLQCARHCTQEKWCNGFFYNEMTGICSLQRMVYVTPEAVVASPGWQLYRVNSPGGQHYVTDRQSGRSYRVELDKFMSWTDAQDRCLQYGDTLAVLVPVVRAQFVLDFLLANTGVGVTDSIFIGMTRPDTGCPWTPSGPDFTWVDGTPLDMDVTQDFWESADQPLCSSNKRAIVLRKSVGWRWSVIRHTGRDNHCLCQRPFLE